MFIAGGFAHGAVQAVDRQEGQAVHLDVIAHALHIHLRRQQLGTFRRVDAIEAAVPGRRAGDAHVHLLRAGLAQHLHDLHRCGAAHDRIIDQHDALARDQRAVGIVLQLHAQVADLVTGLDEGAADIMAADDAQFKGNAALLGIADGAGHPAVGHRHHHVGHHRIFARQLGADALAHFIDAAAVHHRIGAAEIDMFKDARPRPHRCERPDGAQAARRDDDQLARFHRAQEGRAHHVQPHGFGGEDIGVAQPAQHQRPDAERIAAGQHAFGGEADQAVGPFNALQRIDEAIQQGAIGGGGNQVDDHFGVAGRLEDRTAPHQFAAQGGGVGDIAVVRHGKTAAGQFGKQRLHVAQRGFAGGGITVVADGDFALQLVDHRIIVEIAGHMAHGAVGVEILAIKCGDAGGFLAAVLQGVQAQRHQCGRPFGAMHREHAAFLVEMVLFPRIGGEHRFHGWRPLSFGRCRAI